MENRFKVDYSEKKIELTFDNETFKFDLNDGDVGDFWNSFTKKDGTILDINFYQEDKNQKPSISVYGLKKQNGELTIDTNNGTYIQNFETKGKQEDYFGDSEQGILV